MGILGGNLVGAAFNIGAGLLLDKLFGPKKPNVVQEGPRVQDLAVQGASYGDPIAFGYGVGRAAGSVIWSPGLQEVANTTIQEGGGKGGGGGGSVTTTTYTYFVDMAILLCEGPVDKILRIWADTKLIYDATSTSSPTTGKHNIRIYLGTEAQEPDPLIESIEGVGEVSANKGMCYLVFDNMALADFGNRIPNISAEIAFAGTTTNPFLALSDPADILSTINDSGANEDNIMFIDPLQDVLYHLENGATDGLARMQFTTMKPFTGFNNGAPFSNVRHSSISLDLTGSITVQGSGNDESVFKINYQTGVTDYTLGGGTVRNSPGVRCGAMVTEDPFVGRIVHNIVGTATLASPNATGVRTYVETGGGTGADFLFADATLHLTRWTMFMYDHHNKRAFMVTDSDTQTRIIEITIPVNVSALGAVPADPIFTIITTLDKDGVDLPNTITDPTGYCMLPDEGAVIIGWNSGLGVAKIDLSDGTLIVSRFDIGFNAPNNWTHNGQFAFLSTGGAAQTNNVMVMRTGDLVLIDGQDVADFVTGESGVTDPSARLTSSSVYDPRNHSVTYIRQGNAETMRVVKIFLNRAAGTTVGLDAVVQDLTIRAGLSAADVDVTDLSTESLIGYIINRQSKVREILEPIQQGFLVGGFESDFIIKWAKRGGAPALTIVANDVGLLDRNEAGLRVEQTQLQEAELPVEVTVRYVDQAKDYQQGSQSWSRDLGPDPTVDTREPFIIDLPFSLSAENARRLAERTLYTIWGEKSFVDLRLPWRYIALDPTDVATLNMPRSTGVTDILRTRIAERDYDPNFRLSLKMTVEDARSNDSTLTTDGGGFLVQVLDSLLPSEFHGLDIPLLGPADATFQQLSRGYFALTGQGAGYPGGILYTSFDNGLTFVEIGSAPFATAVGFTQEALVDPVAGEENSWNETTLQLNITQNADLIQSATELEVINGANTLAIIKSNGDVELVSFQDVTVVDTNVVTVSRLLRGRRGTEPFSTGHLIGEKFVLLEPGRILTINNELARINTQQTFRAVTLGTSLEDAFKQLFTYSGADLRPFSPVEIGATTSTGDVVVTWVRRTRFNGRWGTGVDIPLNETLEQYDVDFLDPSDDSLFRTKTVNDVSTVTYTAAEQSSDGVGATVKIVVYQKSGVVGRGAPSVSLVHTI